MKRIKTKSFQDLIEKRLNKEEIIEIEEQAKIEAKQFVEYFFEENAKESHSLIIFISRKELHYPNQ